MPNKRIDQLPPSGNNIKGTDKLPIFSDGKTERVTIDELTSFIGSGATNTFVSGGTYSGGTLTLGRNDGIDLTIGGLPSVNYQVYTALLTQTGTDAPIPTVLENTLGVTPAWIRVGVGIYIIYDYSPDITKTVVHCPSVPLAGKVWAFNNNGFVGIKIWDSSDSDIDLSTLRSGLSSPFATDVKIPIEIRVYN